MKPMKIAVACFTAASIISLASVLSSFAFDMSWGSVSPLLATASPPVPGQPGISTAEANSLLQGEIGVLTRQGISATRARQAIGVQGLIAKTGLADRVEATMGKRFAGVWFDAANAQMHIGVTSAAGRRAAEAVTQGLGLATHVVETPVKSTWNQLLAAQSRWNRKLASLFATGRVSTGLFAPRNSVSVTLGAAVPEQQRVAIEQEASADTASVIVEVDSNRQLRGIPEVGTACNTFATEKAFCDKTITSGVTILGVEDISKKHSYCTAGPLAISTGPNKADTYLLTAGHCTEAISSWTAFNRSGASSKVGTTVTTVTDDSGDYGDILIEPGAWTQPGSDPVLAVSALWSVKPLISSPVMGVNKPMTGTVNCHEGATIGETCGKVATVPKSGTFLVESLTTGAHSLLVRNGFVEDEGALSAGGDSGGPWLIVTTGKEVYMEGTHVGKVGTTKPIYEPIETSLGSLKLELLTTTNEYRSDGFLWTGPLPGLVLVLSHTTQTFTAAPGLEFSCQKFKGHGVLSKGSAMTTKDMTVAGTYTNCEAAALAIPAELSPAELLLNTDGSMGFVGKPIVITIPALGCSVKINNGGSNSNLKTIKYLNLPQEILAHVEVSKLASLASGGICGTAGEEKSAGLYRGLLLLSVDGGVIKWG